MELEVMRLRNEINKIGQNVNQIVKNNNSHIYREDDKIELRMQMNMIKDLLNDMKYTYERKEADCT